MFLTFHCFSFQLSILGRQQEVVIIFMESPSSSGSSKRAKGFDNIRHVVSCLVDDCDFDLSQCRDYHRRHKVCDFHSKTPKVTIGGWEQRFCQQCSRFHSLGEFDDGKRSCRKRLDSHNKRRRKPSSECLSNSPRRFLPNDQGDNLLSFSTTQQLLPSAKVDSIWAGPLKLENIVSGPYYCQDNNFGGGNQSKIDYPIPEPLFSDSGNSNGYDPARVADSDCALSLLSSVTTAENRGIGIGYSLVPSMQYCEEPMPLSYNGPKYHHSQGLFHDGPEGPSPNEPNPTLSFKWE